MKILLIGDYSGVHSFLRDALIKLGHEVLLVSTGDGYKRLKADIIIEESNPTNKFMKIVVFLSELLGLKGIFLYFLKFRYIFLNLKNYDVVQFINPIPLDVFGSIASYFLIRDISKNNKNYFLCALGDDYFWVKYCLNKGFDYSMFDKLRVSNFLEYRYSLKYIYGLFYRNLNVWVAQNSDLVIASLDDYYYPYHEAGVNVVKLHLPILGSSSSLLARPTGDEITIFHGWQLGKESRKGNDVLDQAAQMLIEKYGKSRINYKIVQSVSYSEYVRLFDEADIFFDQIYSQDCGVNAILGMRAGKVVFSGFESSPRFFKDQQPEIKEWGVNASVSAEENFNILSYLVDNKCVIDDIKKASLEKSEVNDSLNVATEYLAVWSDSIKQKN